MEDSKLAFLTVDKDGTECIWNSEPEREYIGKEGNGHENLSPEDFIDDDGDELPINEVMNAWVGGPEGCIFLPIGSIEKLVKEKLTWEDEPFELCE